MYTYLYVDMEVDPSRSITSFQPYQWGHYASRTQFGANWDFNPNRNVYQYHDIPN